MCLISKTDIPKVAIKPIPVYKVLTRCECDVLRTPYRNTTIPKVPYMQKAEGTQTIVRKVSRSRNLYPFFKGDFYEITEGFVHAFTNREDALVDVATHNKPWVIIKGHIPKGTSYFVGADNDTICATKIKLEHILFEQAK